MRSSKVGEQTDKQRSITEFFPTSQRQMKEKPKKLICRKRPRAVESTPSLELYMASRPVKRAKVSHDIAHSQENAPRPYIGISYRSDAEGKGAVFDHQAIQLATDQATAAINLDSMTKKLDHSVRAMAGFLKYGEKTDSTDFKFMPVLKADDPKIGLIVITGVSAKSFHSSDYVERIRQENEIIAAAEKSGRPMAFICGGLWAYIKHYGGEIKSVEGHNYRGGMPRLGSNDAVPCNNKEMHLIKIKDEASLLKASLGKSVVSGQSLGVNSVHAYAPDENFLPGGMSVSATALADARLAPANCKATDKSIEAVESNHGAPWLGYQWHPEAYPASHPYAHSLKYMANAGQTYTNRQRLVAAFKEDYFTAINKLKKTNKLGYNFTVVKKKAKTQESNVVVRFCLFKLKMTNELRHIDEVKNEITLKENYISNR